MAVRKALAHRLRTLTTRAPSPAITTANSDFRRRDHLASPPESERTGFFRRIFRRQATYLSAAIPSEFLSLPVGEKLKETIRNMNLSGDRIRLAGLSPPPQAAAENLAGGISVLDAKKILRISMLQKLKFRLRETNENSISYGDFVRVCVDGCGGSEDQGLEFARLLDQAGIVIVLGNIVFLRPEQIAKSMEALISQSIAIPNDPRRRELDQMEKQKALIDKKAQSLVRGELYCGMGFFVLQTLAFMRLTFWELSWDVMEPICFFVGSIYCTGAYGFFLRTSKEPTFVGYFERRFKSKQKKLMEAKKFDFEKYEELCKAFYPNYSYGKTCSEQGMATGFVRV